jgi:hypothetical protein
MININDVSPVDIASIHATILSIIIATITAYAIYIYNNLDSMESRIFYEAERINRELNFTYINVGPTKEILLASDINKREELINMWLRLFQYKNIGKNTEQRGEEAVKIMNAISLFYPFPARARIISDNRIENIKQQPILFNNWEMVEKWIHDIWQDTNIILSIGNTFDLEKRLLPLL